MNTPYSIRATVTLAGSRRITLVCLSGLKGTDKHDAIDILVRHAVDTSPTALPSAEEVVDAVIARESLGSTSVGEGVAFPHAVLPSVDHSVVCVAAASEPILWDPPDKEVRLVVLFVGSPESHLPVMSQVARALRQSELVETIGAKDRETGVPRDASFAVPSADEISRRLRNALGASPEVRFPEDNAWNRRMVESAVAMKGVDDGIAVALIAATFAETAAFLDDPLSGEIGYLLYEVGGTPAAATATKLEILPSRRIDDGALHNILEREYGRGSFSDLASLVVLWGVPGSNRVTRLLIHHFGAVSSVSLPPDVSDFVFARVMQVARDIAIEGREGKPVGASFVLGDVDEIHAHTTQMIINPFSGCPETERNILDPSLEETVKEFARIDGAFVVHGDGLIESAGTYLSVPRQMLEHDAGHGARHTSAQGITAVCDCVAVVISESTRRISVFRRGERVEVV